MRTIAAAECLSDEAVEALSGKFMGPGDFDTLVADDARVVRPDGSTLLIYRREAIPAEHCRAAYAALRTAASMTENRGSAGGEIGEQKTKRPAGVKNRTMYRPILVDGTLSNTSFGIPVNSGIVGYYDRYQRIPYCRTTAFNLEKPEKFAAALPFIRAADATFAELAPDRYAAQRAVVERTSPDFVIHGTAFTTVTVNKNWQTALHVDRGDYRPGFGVMSALRHKRYDGGFLVFPKYRVAVDMRTRGVLLADVHQWHGNTPIFKRDPDCERLSTVLYYRESMHKCGSAAEELERAKNRKPGDPLWG